MRDRVKRIYVWLSIPLLAWLLYAWADLRLYQSQTIRQAAHEYSFSLAAAEDSLRRALHDADAGDIGEARSSLARANSELARAVAAAAIYSQGLDRYLPHALGLRMPQRSFGIDFPEQGWYRGLLTPISGEMRQTQALSPHNRMLIETMIVDLALMQELLPGELLITGNKAAIRTAQSTLHERLQLDSLFRQP